MSIFHSLFRKTASISQSKTIRVEPSTVRTHRNAVRSQQSLMDRVGSVEVSE